MSSSSPFFVICYSSTWINEDCAVIHCVRDSISYICTRVKKDYEGMECKFILYS